MMGKLERITALSAVSLKLVTRSPLGCSDIMSDPQKLL
jgi:hypothetical protein